MPALEKLLEELESHWGFEDSFYRFYHQSFKIYYSQDLTCGIVEALRKYDQDKGLNPWFLEIVAQGIGQNFTTDTNRDWTNRTRPILEAFFHAKTFLALAVQYTKSLVHVSQMMPSGWASVLYLYNVC